jgi:hypothetical protein
MSLDGREREALKKLVAAAKPYIENAAPHEQLFNGEDHRNFHALHDAMFDAETALAVREEPRDESEPSETRQAQYDTILRLQDELAVERARAREDTERPDLTGPVQMRCPQAGGSSGLSFVPDGLRGRPDVCAQCGVLKDEHLVKRVGDASWVPLRDTEQEHGTQLQADPDSSKGLDQRLIEIVIGPCTRNEADEYCCQVQDLFDRHLPGLAAAVGVRYSVEAT